MSHQGARGADAARIMRCAKYKCMQERQDTLLGLTIHEQKSAWHLQNAHLHATQHVQSQAPSCTELQREHELRAPTAAKTTPSDWPHGQEGCWQRAAERLSIGQNKPTSTERQTAHERNSRLRMLDLERKCARAIRCCQAHHSARLATLCMSYTHLPAQVSHNLPLQQPGAPATSFNPALLQSLM